MKYPIDTSVTQKIQLISKKLYNQGLEQANNRDLTGAIASLQKSLLFDKSNIQAHNLLGLVYYEIGQIGLALKHWVLSSNFQKEDNLAFTYMKQVQNDKRTLEKQTEAIKKYNQALQALQQKSEDMAYIQLKSIVLLHPKFVEAHCLLALCAIKSGEPARALEAIEQALSIDHYHPLALRYYQHLKPNKIRPVTTEKPKREVQRSVPQYSRQGYQKANQKQRSNWGALNFIGLFVTGAVCMAALMYILVIPNKINELKQEITQVQQKAQQDRQKIETDIANYQAQIQQLQQENSTLETTNKTLAEEQKRLDEIQKIQQISLLVQQNKVEEAAPLIYAIDTSLLNSEQQATHEQWVQTVYPKAAKIFYDQGVRNYNQGKNDAAKYIEAQYLFEQSLRYSQNEYFSDDALYFIGAIHENIGETKKAIEVYEKLLEQYPNTNQRNNARTRLQRLKPS